MKPDTSTGHKGLELEEPLLFELNGQDRSGVDLREPDVANNRLGGLERTALIGLPGLSEPEVVRHFVRLSQKNYSIDGNLYPLGSCSMKHNPRLNEKIARLPGFADAHPLQPEIHRPGRVAGAGYIGPLAAHHHRDASGGLVPSGWRPRRTLRPNGHPFGPHGPR